jgi:hypothetical protein
MKNQMRKLITVLTCVIGIGITILLIVAFIASRDIPNPDTRDLAVIRPEIAPEANAFTYFIAATKTFYWPEDSDVIMDYLDEKPVDPVALSELFNKNTQMFACVNQGIKCQDCIVPAVTNFTTPPIDLFPLLDISRVMAAKTRYDRLTGRPLEATETCILLIQFSNLIQKNPEAIIHYFIGISALNQGLLQAQELARDIRTPPEEIERLGSALKKIGPLYPGLDRALKTEIVCISITLDQLRDNKLKLSDLPGFDSDNLKPFSSKLMGKSYFFQPNRTKLGCAEYYRKRLTATPMPYADFKPLHLDRDNKLKNGTNLLDFFLQPNAVGRYIYEATLPSMENYLEQKCRMESSLSATRLIIACQQYRHAHGKLPNDLPSLVPTYLPCIPTDPYDGKPLRYNASKGIIYSIGKDLQDSGGSTNALENTTSGSQKLSRSDAEDAVYEVEVKVSHE